MVKKIHNSLYSKTSFFTLVLKFQLIANFVLKQIFYESPVVCLIMIYETWTYFTRLHLISRFSFGNKRHVNLNWTMSKLCVIRVLLRSTLPYKQKQKSVSPTGNWTPVSRVTGGDTYHYTIEDPILKDWIHWVSKCKKTLSLILISCW